MIDLVYSNSCSFGAPNQGHKVYADYVAENFGAKLINNGIPGSCNRRIIRSALRDLLGLQPTKQKILVLVGLSFISRTELWQSDLPPAEDDGHFHPIIIDHDKISWKEKGQIDTIVPNVHELARSAVQGYYKQWLAHLSLESEVTNLLTDLIMFTGWLQSKNIKYLIFCNTNTLPSEPQVGLTSPFISSLVRTVCTDENLLNFWEFSFRDYALSNNFTPKDADRYGIHGHPGADAHQLFGNFLSDKLMQLR